MNYEFYNNKDLKLKVKRRAGRIWRGSNNDPARTEDMYLSRGASALQRTTATCFTSFIPTPAAASLSTIFQPEHKNLMKKQPGLSAINPDMLIRSGYSCDTLPYKLTEFKGNFEIEYV